MPLVLFADGKKVGEISEWKLNERAAEKRMVLGKEILMPKPNDQCQFVSPKPVNRRNELIVVGDDKSRFVLSEIRVTGGTQVTATVKSKS